MGARVDTTRFSRRDFLSVLGAVAVGAALGDGFTGLRYGQRGLSAPSRTKSTRTGSIVALFSSASAHSTKVIEGLTLGLNPFSGLSLRAIPVSRDNAQDVVQQVEKLAVNRDVDLVVGAMNLPRSAVVRSILRKNHVPFLFADGGANMIRAAEQNEWVFTNSLGYWTANLTMGDWLASNVGRTGAVAASDMEMGYDSFYAFRAGYESAGGTALRVYPTDRQEEKAGWANTLSQIERAKPDFVYAMYGGKSAAAFVRAYMRSSHMKNVPLAISPFGMDAVSSLGNEAAGIRSCLPWMASLDAPENSVFMQSYVEHTGKSPDSFALLGYDTAQLILNAAGRLGDEPRAIRHALAAASWSSPRGDLHMSAANTSTVPLYLVELREYGRNTQSHLVRSMPAVEEQDQRLEALRVAVRSGYTNPYPEEDA